MWLNPRTITPVLRESAQQRARAAVQFDYKSFRPGEEQKVLRDEFAGKRANDLAPEEKERLDQMVNERLDALRSKAVGQQLPELLAKEERVLKTFEAATAALVFLALDPKS